MAGQTFTSGALAFNTCTSFQNLLTGMTRMLNSGLWDMQWDRTSWQPQGLGKVLFCWALMFGKFTTTLKNAQKKENARTQPAWHFMRVVLSNLHVTMPSAYRWENVATAEKTVRTAVMNGTAKNWSNDSSIIRNILPIQKLVGMSLATSPWQFLT